MAFEEFDFAKAAGAGYESVKQASEHVSAVERTNEVDVENAGDDAKVIWAYDTELFPYEDMGKSFSELEGKESVFEPFHCAEWDDQIQLERPAWATALERQARSGACS